MFTCIFRNLLTKYKSKTTKRILCKKLFCKLKSRTVFFISEPAARDLGWKTSGGTNLLGGVGSNTRSRSFWTYAFLQFVLIAFVQQIGSTLAGITRNFDLEVWKVSLKALCGSNIWNFSQNLNVDRYSKNSYIVPYTKTFNNVSNTLFIWCPNCT